jgi:cytosine/adenosine deaminase-related metal-dependent hydrolase
VPIEPATQASPRLVLRDCVVAGEPPRAGVTVVVEGRRIARIAPAGEGVAPRPGDWEVEGAGRLLVPGGVDGHTHLSLAPLLRLAGLPERFPGSTRQLRLGFRHPAEARLDPAALEALATAGALAALKAGTTCVLSLDRGEPGLEAESLAAAARAVGRVGVRAVLAYGASDLGGSGFGPAGVRAAAAFARDRREDPRVRGMAGLDGLFATTDETLEALAAPCADHGLHASVSEDGADLERAWALDGKRPVELLEARGLLGPRTVLAHGSTIGSDEAHLVRRADSVLVTTPRAVAWWAGEPPPYELLAAHETPMALGTDGVFPDLAGTAVAVTVGMRRRRSGPLPPAEMLGHVLWPTAAVMAGQLFGERLGVLEEGALADLVLLDWRPSGVPPEGTDGDVALLWAGAPAAWVVVDGEVRLREGQPLGLDPAEVAARATEAGRRVLAG